MPGIRKKEIMVDRKTQKYLETFQRKMRDELFSAVQVSALKSSYCDNRRGILKKNSRLQAGLALSVFGDFEKPAALEVKAVKKPDEDNEEAPAATTPEPITGNVLPDSSYRFRFTARPTVTYRPNNRVEMSTHYYWKQDLEELLDGGPGLFASDANVRSEFRIAGKIALAVDHTGAETVALELSATQYHNRIPPSVTAVQAAAGLNLAGENMTAEEAVALYDFTGLSARRNHTLFKFALKVSW